MRNEIFNYLDQYKNIKIGDKGYILNYWVDETDIQKGTVHKIIQSNINTPNNRVKYEVVLLYDKTLDNDYDVFVYEEQTGLNHVNKNGKTYAESSPAPVYNKKHPLGSRVFVKNKKEALKIKKRMDRKWGLIQKICG